MTMANFASQDLESVIITPELGRRPARSADLTAENRALISLASVLTGSFERFLQKVAEAALALCQAHSAGVSLLEANGKGLHWPAVVGEWAVHAAGGTSRGGSPCGIVLERNAAQLLAHPGRYFTALAGVAPQIEEMLSIPFCAGGRAVGTIWVMAHDGTRRFDAEDLRVMRSLGQLATAAYQASSERAHRHSAIQSSFREVGARNSVEDALRDSEERFRMLADNMSQLAWMCDRFGEVTWYNRRWYEYTGLTFEDMRGWDWSRVQHPDHLARVVAGVRLSRDTGQPWEDTFPLRGRDGTYRWFLSRAIPIRDEQGHVVRWFGTNTDVTESRQTDAFMQCQKEAFEMAASGLPLLAVLARLAASIEQSSLQGLMVAIHLLDSTGTRFEHTAAPSLPATYIAAVNGMEVGSAAGPCCVALLRGECVAVEDVAGDSRFPAFAAFALPLGIRAGWSTPIISSTGKPLGTVANYYREPRASDPRDTLFGGIVTRTASVVIERCQALEALRESEERFRTLSNAAPALIWQNDAEGGNLDVNQRFLDFVGMTAQEIRGGGWRAIVHPEDLEAYLADYLAAVHARRGWNNRVRVRHLDGQWHWFDCHAQPLFGADGSYLGQVGASVDITERRKIEEAVRESQRRMQEQAAELADLHRRKDEFLAMLSHELRNPLAPILNAVQILRLDKEASPLQQQARAVIDRQVQQLVRLVNDLLEVSRVISGRIRLRLEYLDIRGILEQAVESTRPLFDQRRQELTVSLPGEPVGVQGDAARLEQVVVNLLNNAAKYTDQGGRIQLSATQEDDEVALRVRDTGVGIAPELLPRIFDLFTQADRSLDRSQGGLGVGLTVVRRLTEMHGGTIAAYSAGPAQGSEFTVRLPVASAAASESSTLVEDWGKSSRPRRRVLIVEDNTDAAQTLAWVLQEAGHEVRVAHSGQAALEMAAEYRPSAVLVDIGLPGMDGYEVGRRLRRIPQLEGVALVALTGYGQDSDLERSRDAGFDHHLVKPADPRELQALLTKLASRACRQEE